MESLMMYLNSKFFLITGGNSGIGLATAHALVEAGAKVAIFGRDQQTVDAAVAALGEGSIGVAGDVSRNEDLDRLFAEVKISGQKLDGLFVNAGIGTLVSIADLSEAMFDNLIGINLRGAFFTVQKALPLMNDGGSIVFTSTAGWHQGVPGYSLYGASKAALVGLSNSLAGELAPRGIRVNTVSPGAIETPIIGRLGLPEEQSQDIFNSWVSNCMAGRVGNSSEVGLLVRFLLSDEASYINGIEVPIDGGYLLGKPA
jgi:NAD(P)-dependent dehydrogenase (short-subunit alcohol dehydrogenase family)